MIEDDLRRINQFEKLFSKKDLLDFGCGMGGFLRNVKNAKSINGIELRKECIDYIQNNIKKINISNNINSFSRTVKK